MKSFLFLFVSCVLSINSEAQYTLLHQFVPSDGGYPSSGLILLGDSLYSTTTYGENNITGTLYRIHPNGTGFKVIHQFSLDEAYPGIQLTNIDDTLFGIATSTTIGKELIYRINKDGSDFRVLKIFKTSDGTSPSGKLLRVNNYLYGMTAVGGLNNCGVVYRIDSQGDDYKIIHHFSKLTSGSNPMGALTFSNGYVYGISGTGGLNDKGTLFCLKTNGDDFKKLYDFDIDLGYLFNFSLKMIGDTIWGITTGGGDYNTGIIYKIMKDGTNFKKLFSMGVETGKGESSLVFDGNHLYGIAACGGASDTGAIYRIDLEGQTFEVLLNFVHEIHGSLPFGNPLLIDDYYYGLTAYGGPLYSNGVLYKYKIPRKPCYQSSDVNDDDISDSSICINWLPGTEYQYRAVFVKRGNSGLAQPEDNKTYNANVIFAKGSEIDTTGWYCVYNGSGKSTQIQGLEPETNYVIMVCEYNGTPGTEKYKKEKNYGNPVLKTTLEGEASEEEEEEEEEEPIVVKISKQKLTDVSVYPNPTKGFLHIELPWAGQSQIHFYDMLGIDKLSFTVYERNNIVDVSHLKPGNYYVEISMEGKKKTVLIRIE